MYPGHASCLHGIIHAMDVQKSAPVMCFGRGVWNVDIFLLLPYP